MLDGSNKNRYGCPRVAASVIILISPSIIVDIRPYVYVYVYLWR